MKGSDAAGGLLRSSLRANAVFSGASGAAFTFLGGPVGAFLGVEPMLVIATGVNLLCFAAILLYVAARPVLPAAVAWAIVGADLAWVVGTLVLVALGAFTQPGTMGALGVGGVVLAFAALQSAGIRRLRNPALGRAAAPR